jgi:hypothetical protein
VSSLSHSRSLAFSLTLSRRPLSCRLPPSLLACWRLHTALPPCSSGTTFVVQFLPNFVN